MSFIDDSLNNYYDGIRVKGNCVASKYLQLWKAIKIGEELEKRGKISKIEYDDPNEQLCVHGCVVKLSGDEFSNDEVKMLAEFMTCFDKVSLIDDIGVNISALLYGVYLEA